MEDQKSEWEAKLKNRVEVDTFDFEEAGKANKVSVILVVDYVKGTYGVYPKGGRDEKRFGFIDQGLEKGLGLRIAKLIQQASEFAIKQLKSSKTYMMQAGSDGSVALVSSGPSEC